jgi:hypothetical protein
MDRVTDGPGIFPSSNEEHIIAIGESSSSRKSLTEAIQGELDVFELLCG